MFKYLINVLIMTLIVSCSSGPVKPTTDKCALEKHFKDNIFQVQINGNPINKHWYTYPEARDIWDLLAKDNKCMARK